MCDGIDQVGSWARLIARTFHARRLMLVLVYRPHETNHSLQSLDDRMNAFRKVAKWPRTVNTVTNESHGDTCTHRAMLPLSDVNIGYLHLYQPRELHNDKAYRLRRQGMERL